MSDLGLGIVADFLIQFWFSNSILFDSDPFGYVSVIMFIVLTYGSDSFSSNAVNYTGHCFKPIQPVTHFEWKEFRSQSGCIGCVFDSLKR